MKLSRKFLVGSLFAAAFGLCIAAPHAAHASKEDMNIGVGPGKAPPPSPPSGDGSDVPPQDQSGGQPPQRWHGCPPPPQPIGQTAEGHPIYGPPPEGPPPEGCPPPPPPPPPGGPQDGQQGGPQGRLPPPDMTHDGIQPSQNMNGGRQPPPGPAQ